MRIAVPVSSELRAEAAAPSSTAPQGRLSYGNAICRIAVPAAAAADAGVSGWNSDAAAQHRCLAMPRQPVRVS